MTLQAHKTGLALGGVLGLFHLVWSLLIALGVAQSFMDFIFMLHRIAPVYHVLPFDLSLAVGLVIVTSVIGYIVGYAFAMIRNQVQGK